MEKSTKLFLLSEYKEVLKKESDGLTVRIMQPHFSYKLPTYEMDYVIDSAFRLLQESINFNEEGVEHSKTIGGNPDFGAWDALLFQNIDVDKKQVDVYFCAFLCRPYSQEASDTYGKFAELDLEERIRLLWDSRIFDFGNFASIDKNGVIAGNERHPIKYKIADGCNLYK